MSKSLKDLLEQTEQETAAIKAEFEAEGILAKAMDEDTDLEEELENESEDDEDEDDEEGEDEPDGDEPMAKSLEDYVDATDVISALVTEVRALRAELAGVKKTQGTMAKAMVAQLEQGGIVAKAYGAALKAPAKPKSLKVPTAKEEQVVTYDSETTKNVVAKALNEIEQTGKGGVEFAQFNGIVKAMGLKAALDAFPQYRKHVG